jgi:2',3'-cyclic-nucleotide 2'-phosphodiesterase (5'-nucleotidase family)
MVDLARKYYDTDIAAINAGSIRNDTVIPAGKLTYAKISNIINSPLVVKKITGQVILEMLEYSVAATPEYSGAFLIVSGLSFEYDWNKKPKIINVNIGE